VVLEFSSAISVSLCALTIVKDISGRGARNSHMEIVIFVWKNKSNTTMFLPAPFCLSSSHVRLKLPAPHQV
jgi:hypothetical protein